MTRFYQIHSFRSLTGVLLLVLTIVAGCTYDHGITAQVVPCDNATAQLATYSAVVSPIFDQHCRSCHGATYNTPGDVTNYGGGIAFRNYQDIKNYGNPTYILCCVKYAGCDNMPKVGNKLSDCDIARLEAWFNAGTLNN